MLRLTGTCMKQHMHFHLSSHNHDGVFSDKQNWHNGEIIIRGNRTPNSNQSGYTKKKQIWNIESQEMKQQNQG